MTDGLINPALRLKRLGQVIMGSGIIRLDAQGLIIMTDSLIKPAPGCQYVTEIILYFAVVIGYCQGMFEKSDIVTPIMKLMIGTYR